MGDYSDLLTAEKRTAPAPKQRVKPVAAVPPQPQPATPPPDVTPADEQPTSEHAPTDAMTSPRHDVEYRAWKDVIENTETHNSALRLTNEERYTVEDVLNELERTYRVKTSMNELARLGLIALCNDFMKNGKESLIYKVKKS
jgi:hypothetical protein